MIDPAPHGSRLRRLRRPSWGCFDYLYLSFSDATAFSPTDVMPLARGAKLGYAVQAVCSLVILGVVIAGAVNIFK